MSTPNTYSDSSVCGPAGGRALQNVALRWADGSAGDLADLLRWAQGRLLLLVFGLLKPGQLRRIVKLAEHTDMRSVHVPGRGTPAITKEHVLDPEGHVAASVGGAGWALLRPDSYIAATGQHMDAEFARVLNTVCGNSP